ncbi:MAG: DUF4912 domain-containing protein [Planctomycetota bacterium]|nr:DUF4912 domain-containing protein [Planctomycetota bacterium]MCX8040161.1 DUF4912 domain-containing protein [Planctomycetota bacterium]MDW8372544.1 DUF4912 domain-containing protein [Planctomycetota bacterium]
MSTHDLDRLSTEDLRALATGRGIPAAAQLSRAELIAALASQLAQERREPPAPAAAGGSSLPPQAPAAWQPPPPEHGLPIPDQYGRDRLVLMVQDPAHIFAYWELTQETLARARANAAGGSPVLVIHGPGGSEQREVDLAGGNYYLTVAPKSEYRAELCLRAADGRLVSMVASGSVVTPPAGPSWRTDESWMEVDEHFDDLLATAGSPGEVGSSWGAGSGQRFRAARRLRARLLEEAAAEGAAVPVPEELVQAPSSLAVTQVAPLSSAALSSGELARRAAEVYASASGVGLSSWAVGVGVSSAVLSSAVLSSRVVSSRSVGSGGGAFQVEAAEAQYPVQGVFEAPPTGLPKAAEGLPVAEPPPAPAPPAASGEPAPPPPPPAPNAAVPAPPHDPLAFIGAPKPPELRKPKPPRA